MSDLMQVDNPTTTTTTTTTSPSPELLVQLNKDMNEFNALCNWSERIRHISSTPTTSRSDSDSNPPLPKGRLSLSDSTSLDTVFGQILVTLTSLSPDLNLIKAPNRSETKKLLERLATMDDDDQGLLLEEWEEGVRVGVEEGDWTRLASHPILQKYSELSKKDQEKQLASFYSTPNFIGPTAQNLISHLKFLEPEISSHRIIPCAKAFFVLQSSGTGKSRMLIEAGKSVFTLPICFTRQDGGMPNHYPPPDLNVVEYFDYSPKATSFSNEGDSTRGCYIAVACFIAAAHMTMHERLKSAKEKEKEKEKVGDHVVGLREYWHDRMDSPVGVGDPSRTYRKEFFQEVVGLAKSLKVKHQNLQESNSIKAFQVAPTVYRNIIKPASEGLMRFLSSTTTIDSDAPEEAPLCVTYIDEAHGMDIRTLWVLLRLLQYQPGWLRMWFIFLGTESSKTLYYVLPPPKDMSGLRLIEEIARPLPPYMDLGFDQHAIANANANAKEPRTVTMREIQSVEHLVQYGRPLWKALLSSKLYHYSDLISIAGTKLTNGDVFSAKNKDHVFAVLSHRLSLDPVLSRVVWTDSDSEATAAARLTDRGVAHHMRLLTGLSDDNTGTFYTHSPSEPMLALGAAHLLYNNNNDNDNALGDGNLLPETLKTFCKDLCRAGLVEKGTMMGELAARTLLLVARDFTAARQTENHLWDLLKPVRVLDYLDTLFGGEDWAEDSRHRSEFERAFADAYVNFTHWVVTKDSMPVVEPWPDPQLLANLWARGAALQYSSFHPNPINITIPVYYSNATTIDDPNALFDPCRLSGISVQVKSNLSSSELLEVYEKGRILQQPLGIPRDSLNPLSYLALFMELDGSDSESDYHQFGFGKIKATACEPTFLGGFSKLTTALTKAVGEHAERVQQVLGNNKSQDLRIKELKEKVSNAQLAVDSYNRYVISVRGASPEVYGVLKMAGMVDEFASLLDVTGATQMSGVEKVMQHMRPLERLGDGSNHTAWMAEYVTP